MTSFWTKAARLAAQARNERADSDVIRPDFGAEQKAHPSIRRDPPPPSEAAIAIEDPLRLRLSEELEYARRMLTWMDDELASDVVIVGRHLAELQTIDIVSQMLGHIAAVVRSSGAVDAIGMSALKARLMRTQSSRVGKARIAGLQQRAWPGVILKNGKSATECRIRSRAPSPRPTTC